VTRTAVITVVAGRRQHLLNQLRGLRDGRLKPDLHVVVAMGDPAVTDVVRGFADTCVIDLVKARPLRLAEARNVGADAALAAGAEHLIFLDVDCVPSSTLVQRYASLLEVDAHRDALLCGEVNYVSSSGQGENDLRRLARLSSRHLARPTLGADEVIPTVQYELFWSLSFGVGATAWKHIGGFCESYVGYGGEDTDFGQSARAAGVTMMWVGGAVAYHQYHPVSDPPFEHLDEILRNAETFHARWGWWPMQGWLRKFQSIGLISYDDCRQAWRKAD